MSEAPNHREAEELSAEVTGAMPAVHFNGVVPRFRPLAIAGAAALIFLFPFCVTTLTPAMYIALPLMLAVMAVGAFAGWFVAMGELLPATVRVGSDGVLISWMGTKRFFSYEGMHVAIAVGGTQEESSSVNVPTEAVQLTYKDGRTYKFGAPRSVYMNVAAAINERLDAFQRSTPSPLNAIAVPEPSVQASLQRNDKDVGKWLAELEHQPNDPYRTNLSRDQLLAVLRDPASPATARAAAAKLLRLRVEDRPLIRVVAAETAQPKVRVALEHAASDEEEATVNRALAKVVDQ
jgi:hypothetical protein